MSAGKPLDRQPVLHGERVMLRALEPGDWSALFAVASDPRIWAMHPFHDRWQEPVFRRFFDDALASGGALLASDAASGEVIGSSRYDAYDGSGGGSVEIGWTFLSPTCWGQGHNREMKALMVGHALQSVRLVEFRVGETNWRSRRAMEKVGARLAPSRRQVTRQGDREFVHVYYEIDRESFAAGPLCRLR